MTFEDVTLRKLWLAFFPHYFLTFYRNTINTDYSRQSNRQWLIVVLQLGIAAHKRRLTWDFAHRVMAQISKMAKNHLRQSFLPVFCGSPTVHCCCTSFLWGVQAWESGHKIFFFFLCDETDSLLFSCFIGLVLIKCKSVLRHPGQTKKFQRKLLWTCMLVWDSDGGRKS